MPQSQVHQFFENTRDAKKVVVVDLGFLGDTVHLIPALWEIKLNYPAAELHVLTSPVGREVLKMASCVDRAWAFPLGPPSPSWWEHWDVLRAMRRERFDVAFNFSGADRSVFVTAALRPRHSMAYQGARKHFWQSWLVRHWIARATLPTPVHESRRQVLAWCGLALKPARFDLAVPVPDRDWAREHIPVGAVHLSLSASFALKEWPFANNLDLARNLLAGNHQKLVVSAAPNARERARAEQLRREIKDERLLVFSEGLPVTRLAAVLERCAVHVGPDSGVIHLAAALGNLDGGDFSPLRGHGRLAAGGPATRALRRPLLLHGFKKSVVRGQQEAACLAIISPELVAAEIRKRLTLAEGEPRNA